MYINLEYIKALASNHEAVDVEFKETTGQLNRGMKTLCGMVNGKGGIVIFGVTNKGTIVGQEVGDKTTREIGEALKKFDPALDIEPIYIPIDETGKNLIVFKSDGQESDKPYMWDGKPYQRHDSVTSVMPRERFLRIHEQQSGLTYKWENDINDSLNISDLDENLILNIVQGGVRRGRLSPSAMNDNVPTALKRLKLIKDCKICNSAAILFGKNFIDYPQSMIRLARFRGIDKKEFIDNQQIEGNIFELADAAMAFFFKHLSLSGTTHGRIRREDELEIPYDALREAVVNSLCHRAWQQEASTIGIAIYDDRIEIENAGRFPANLSPLALTKEEEDNDAHTSLPPNPVIANVMFIGGLIEHWGRGLSMMNNECERVGLPIPRITDNGFMVKVIFKRPSANGISHSEHKLNTSRTQEELKKNTVKGQNDTVSPEKNILDFNKDTVGAQKDTVNREKDTVRARKDTVKDTVEHQLSTGRIPVIDQKDTCLTLKEYQLKEKKTLVGKREKQIIKIINIIGEDWYSAGELSEALGHKSKNTFIRNYINPMLESGLLVKYNLDNTNASNQRYRLTVKGKAIYYSNK